MILDIFETVTSFPLLYVCVFVNSSVEKTKIQNVRMHMPTYDEHQPMNSLFPNHQETASLPSPKLGSNFEKAS